MKLKKSWQKAWDLGRAAASEFSSEEEAVNAMDMDTLEDFGLIDGFPAFFHAGYINRKPEWVEAIRFGEIPDRGYSINWSNGEAEPGVSCVKIIRDESDADTKSLYSLTLADRDIIRVAGWWIGLSGSDGEPTLLGAVKVVNDK